MDPARPLRDARSVPASHLRAGPHAAHVPAAEADRDGDDAVIRLELPGLDVAKDVAVEVADGQLVVHGERRDERTEQEGGRRLRELRYGSFRRSFALLAHVTAEAINASYDAGVLTVRVTGAYAGIGSRKIEVTTGGTPAVETGRGAPRRLTCPRVRWSDHLTAPSTALLPLNRG
ncbi:MAG: Hsp20/alpha crystallin family protein [Pseudonocardia sp.]